MSPTKIGPANQHEVLHGHYGPSDCCLCRLEAEVVRLQQEVEIEQAKNGQRQIVIDQLRGKVERLREALQDFEKRGLHCDLNPTMQLRDVPSLYEQFASYLRRADEQVRERARRALVASPDKPPALDDLVEPPPMKPFEEVDPVG